MGGAVAALGPIAIGLLPEHGAVGAGQNRAKGMVAGVARAARDAERPSQQLEVGLPLRHETLLRAAEFRRRPPSSSPVRRGNSSRVRVPKPRRRSEFARQKGAGA